MIFVRQWNLHDRLSCARKAEVQDDNCEFKFTGFVNSHEY